MRGLLVTGRVGRWWLVLLLFGFNLAFVDYRVIPNNGDNLFTTVMARTVFSDQPFQVPLRFYYLYRPEDPLLHHQYYKPPFYATTMAVVYRLLGENVYYQIVLSALVTALTALALAALSRAIWGSPLTGLVAGAFYAVSPPTVYAAVTGMEDGLAALFTVLAVWGLVRFQTDRGFRWVLGAGALAGLSVLTSLRGIVVVALLAGIALLVRSLGTWRTLAAGACLLVAFFVVSSPWLLRNYVIFGNPVYTQANLWPWQLQWNDAYAPPRYPLTFAHLVATLGVGGVVARFARAGLTALVMLSGFLSFLVPLILHRLLRFRDAPFGERVLWISIVCNLAVLVLFIPGFASGRHFMPMLAFTALIAVQHARRVAGSEWDAGPRAWWQLARRASAGGIVALIVAVSFVAAVYGDGREYLQRSRSTFSGLSAQVGLWLRTNTRPGDVVMMTYPVTATFYAGRPGLQLPREVPTSFAEEILERYDGTYFVDLDWPNPPPRGFAPVQTVSWGGDSVTIYQRLGAR